MWIPNKWSTFRTFFKLWNFKWSKVHYFCFPKTPSDVAQLITTGGRAAAWLNGSCKASIWTEYESSSPMLGCIRIIRGACLPPSPRSRYRELLILTNPMGYVNVLQCLNLWIQTGQRPPMLCSGVTDPVSLLPIFHKLFPYLSVTAPSQWEGLHSSHSWCITALFILVFCSFSCAGPHQGSLKNSPSHRLKCSQTSPSIHPLLFLGPRSPCSHSLFSFVPPLACTFCICLLMSASLRFSQTPLPAWSLSWICPSPISS